MLRLGLPTVIDEAYHELGETGETLSHLLSEFPNAILLRTFSKAHGLAGMRIGYAISHASVVRVLRRVKVPWSLPSVSLAAALAALEDIEEFEARMGTLRQQRAFLVRELQRIPGLDVIPSEGNFILIDVHRTGIAAETILQEMFSDGVMIRSLAVHRAGRGFLRVSVGLPSENTRCIDVLRTALIRLGGLHPSKGRLQAAIPHDAE